MSDDFRVGVSPSGKAAGFDPAIRRFESFHPSQIFAVGTIRRLEVVLGCVGRGRITPEGRPRRGEARRAE